MGVVKKVVGWMKKKKQSEENEYDCLLLRINGRWLTKREADNMREHLDAHACEYDYSEKEPYVVQEGKIVKLILECDSEELATQLKEMVEDKILKKEKRKI